MLYHNPSPGYPTPGHQAWGSMVPHTFVRVGMISPPGTYLPMLPSGSFLQPGQPTLQFGPFAPCPGTTPTHFTVGPYCFGDTAPGCPDQIVSFVGLVGHGVRYNCALDLGGGQSSNVQTFLGIDPPANPGGGQRTQTPMPRTLSERASREQVLDNARRLVEGNK